MENSGWLARQMAKAQETVDSLPDWMKKNLNNVSELRPTLKCYWCKNELIMVTDKYTISYYVHKHSNKPECDNQTILGG